MKKGLYVQVPNDMQKATISNMGKAYCEYYKDGDCNHPATEYGKQITGITNITNLEFIGFYD